MFELRPKLVVMPHDSKDVQTLISLVAEKKVSMPELSVTARSAGTDMAGGAINESIIVDFNKHLNKVENVTSDEAQTQPGRYFIATSKRRRLKHNALMPLTTLPAASSVPSAAWSRTTPAAKNRWSTVR